MIYTHYNVDLDAVCSVWAAIRANKGAMTWVEFIGANEGPELASKLASHDIVVDVMGPMGHRQFIKGVCDPDGLQHSAFAECVRRWFSNENQIAMAELIEYVDQLDAGTLPTEKRGVYTLNAVLVALKTFHRNDDDKVIQDFSSILDGMLENARSRQRAKVEAESASIKDGVAIARNTRELATNSFIFERGAAIIVYDDGNNLGVIRAQSCNVRTDHPKIRAVVPPEELKEWFAHSAGFLFCRGSKKAPAKTKSRITAEQLAEAAREVLREVGTAAVSTTPVPGVGAD